MAIQYFAPNRLSTGKQALLLALAAGIWAFFVYVRWFASREELLLISRMEIDLVAHVLGGIFLAGIFEWLHRRPALGAFVLFLAGITVGWELLELFFDPAMQFFFANAPDLWLFDTVSDIVGAYLGGYGYWVFLMNRGAPHPAKIRI